jgi:predicted flap endonuclease-1-like 5' DNA nuclease
MELTYESIKPIIVEEIWNGNMVNIKIKAHNQQEPMMTVGVVVPDQEAMMKKMKAEMAKTAASNIAVSTASNALGRLTGISGLGSAVSGAANQMGVGYQMDASKLMQADLTDDEKKQTVVNAFKNLQMYYKFENGQWSYNFPS